MQSHTAMSQTSDCNVGKQWHPGSSPFGNPAGVGSLTEFDMQYCMLQRFTLAVEHEHEHERSYIDTSFPRLITVPVQVALLNQHDAYPVC